MIPPALHRRDTGLLHKKNAGLALADALFTCILLATIRPSIAAGAPLEVYGRLPSLENVALSPSGARLAMVRTVQDRRVVIVLSLADRKLMAKPLNVGELKLRSIGWADDDNLMLVTSTTALPLGLIGRVSEWSMLSVFDVNTQKLHTYPDPDQSRNRIMNVISGQVMVRRIAGHTVLFIPGIYVDDETLPG